MQYKEFKEGVIMNLLFASQGSCAMDLQEKLMNYQEFRNFFNENQKANWYAALNNLVGSNNYLSDILIEMELLSTEVSYVLNNLDSVGDQAYSLFKRLNENIYRLKNNSVYSYDQVKYVGNFIWQIFARWSTLMVISKKILFKKLLMGSKFGRECVSLALRRFCHLSLTLKTASLRYTSKQAVLA